MGAFSLTLTSLSVTSSASLGRSVTVTKVLTDSITSSASAVRQSRRTLLDAVSITATGTKRSKKAVSDTVTTTGVLKFNYYLKRTLSRTVSTSVSFKKRVRTTKQDTVTSTVTFRRDSRRVLRSMTAPKVMFSLRQSLKKTLLATPTTRSYDVFKVSKNLQSSVSATGSVRKGVRKTVTTSVSVIRSLSALFVNGTGWLRWNGESQSPDALELVGVWDGAQVIPTDWYGEEVL